MINVSREHLNIVEQCRNCEHRCNGSIVDRWGEIYGQFEPIETLRIRRSIAVEGVERKRQLAKNHPEYHKLQCANNRLEQIDIAIGLKTGKLHKRKQSLSENVSTDSARIPVISDETSHEIANELNVKPSVHESSEDNLNEFLFSDN